VVTEPSKFIDWPETVFEEINGDVLEADLALPMLRKVPPPGRTKTAAL